MTADKYNILIASYLEPEYVESIRQVDPRLDVIYEPTLLAVPRYAADHYGVPNRSPRTGGALATIASPSRYLVRL